MKNKIILGVAVLLMTMFVIGGYFFPRVGRGLAGAIGSATNFYSIVLDSGITFGGTLVQTGGAAAVAILPGTTVLNNTVYGSAGYSSTITTSRQITPAEFCGTTSILIPQSVVSPITITLPAATSTYVACGAVAGGWSNQYVVNESSVAVTIATSTGGSGISFFVASSTVYAGTLNAGATFPFVIAASTTVMQNGLYTGSSGLNLYTTVLKRL